MAPCGDRELGLAIAAHLAARAGRGVPTPRRNDCKSAELSGEKQYSHGDGPRWRPARLFLTNQLILMRDRIRRGEAQS